MDFDLHVGTEDAALGRQTLCGEQVEKALVEALGDRGWGGLDEAGAAAFAAVAVQGKLRDGEHAAANVEHRAIHLALVVGEDAQVSALFSAEAQGLVVVARAKADEQDQALADLAAELAIDVDASVADALDEDFHGRGCNISGDAVGIWENSLGKSVIEVKCTPRRTTVNHPKSAAGRARV